MELAFDFDTSVKKALSEIDPDWESYEGLIVCGTHTPKHWEPTIEKLRLARETGKPALGICFGYQLMAIEYARNVLGIDDATSEEFGVDGTYVVQKLPELNVGLKDGESWWNNYAVRDDIATQMAAGAFSPIYFGVQYHPEYQSSKEKPHWVLETFLRACKHNNGSVDGLPR